MLLLVSDVLKENISRIAEPLGFEIVWYKHVQKAMDNIMEISPDAAIVSALDFPRHWKIFMAFTNSVTPNKPMPVMLLKDDTFSTVEQKKAEVLGAFCLVDESAASGADGQDDALLRFLKTPRGGIQKAAVPEFSPKRFSLVFSNPLTGVLVTGRVDHISVSGLRFYPGPVSLSAVPNRDAASAGCVIPGCSLRAGPSFLSPICRINSPPPDASAASETAAEAPLLIDFVSFPPGELEQLEEYLLKK
jgi:hypothetical protein